MKVATLMGIIAAGLLSISGVLLIITNIVLTPYKLTLHWVSHIKHNR